jgi:hypothetical protein
MHTTVGVVGVVGGWARVQVGIDAAVTANHHVCVRESDGDGAVRIAGL